MHYSTRTLGSKSHVLQWSELWSYPSCLVIKLRKLKWLLEFMSDFLVWLRKVHKNYTRAVYELCIKRMKLTLEKSRIDDLDFKRISNDIAKLFISTINWQHPICNISPTLKTGIAKEKNVLLSVIHSLDFINNKV